MAGYTTELRTGLIELRWLHQVEFAGPATKAAEEQGMAGMAWRDVAMAGCGCQSVHNAYGYRAMG